MIATSTLQRSWVSAEIIAEALGCDPPIPVPELIERDVREFTATIPAGRLGAPAEVADACLFLAGDASSYITGCTLDVNGGQLMR